MVLLAAHVGYWCVLGMGCEPVIGARSDGRWDAVTYTY